MDRVYFNWKINNILLDTRGIVCIMRYSMENQYIRQFELLWPVVIPNESLLSAGFPSTGHFFGQFPNVSSFSKCTRSGKKTLFGNPTTAIPAVSNPGSDASQSGSGEIRLSLSVAPRRPLTRSPFNDSLK